MIIWSNALKIDGNHYVYDEPLVVKTSIIENMEITQDTKDKF
jgi:hypothetical protein